MSPTRMSAPSRRTIAKGAAWSMPIIAAAAATPTYAASAQPGLQGWVTLGKSCNTTSALTLSGVGAYPDRGIWIEQASATSKATNASLTYYVSSSLGNLTWKAQADNGAWSIPVVDTAAPAKAGFTAYTTKYSGTWSFKSDANVLLASSNPSFTAALTTYSACTAGIQAYATRDVTVDGNRIQFTRGPITL
ncbi:hypothetical protein [Kocuria massiliensis]|uniref:hypothetical protein n=1 Tax=Kocuria massiliensis TaxID=1926282 RepID=UPI0022B9A0DA|nr:hypothetical protein [Kocuria massiliensis]